MSVPLVTLQHRLEFAALCAFLWTVRWLPTSVSLRLLRLMGRLSYLVARQRSRRARWNLERATGILRDSKEARAIVRGCFEGLALQLGEGELLMRHVRRGRSLDECLSVEGEQHVRACLDAGRGVILATGHFGAWETLAFIMRERFKPIWAVARPPENPLVAEWMTTWRNRLIQGTLEKSGGGIKLARLLRDGEIVGMLLDQNASRQGVMLDFFGLPCWQHKVSGVMARRFGVAVLPAYVVREPGYLKFRVVFEAPIEPDPSVGDNEAVEADVVQRLSLSLERRVREHPEQWLWLHDRWRRARRRLKRLERLRLEAEAAAQAEAGAASAADPAAAAVAGAASAHAAGSAGAADAASDPATDAATGSDPDAAAMQARIAAVADGKTDA